MYYRLKNILEELNIKNTNDYLRNLLIYYEPQKINPLIIKQLKNLEDIISYWANDNLKEIKLSGSRAKGTAIKGVADLDLFISIKHSCQNTLKDIYESLYDVLVDYNPRKQGVSIGINFCNLKIDLVPAKVQTGYKVWHYLYVNKQYKERIQTNINLHIKEVSSSQRINEIKLTKIWRENHKLKFPSIYLELLVIKVLKNQNLNQLSRNFKKILEYLSTDFINDKFVDPANTSNIISDDLNFKEKLFIKNKATQSLKQNLWSDVIW